MTAIDHRTVHDARLPAGGTVDQRARRRDGRLRGLVRRHPTTTFFVLAFALTWAGMLPLLLSNAELGVIDVDLPVPAGFPALIWLLPAVYLGPFSAAFTVTALAEGRAGMRVWVRRLIRVRVGWRWYAAVLLGVPATVMLGTLLLPGALAGAEPVAVTVLAQFGVFILLQIVVAGFPEEAGWRDFALPRIQDSFGPVLGTTILGLLWGAWHLPLFLTREWGDWPHVAWWEPVEFIAMGVPLSIVMTWVFNRTGQSLPIVILMHAVFNAFNMTIWWELFPTLAEQGHVVIRVGLIGFTIVAVALIVATRGRLGLPTRAEHRAA